MRHLDQCSTGPVPEASELEAKELGSPRVLVLEASAKSRRTSSQRKPRNWIRSRRTTHPKSRGQRTPPLDQCSTGAVLAQASAVGSGLVWAAEWAAESAALVLAEVLGWEVGELSMVSALGSALVWAPE